MISTTTNFDAAAANKLLKPVYIFTIVDYPTMYVYRTTGRDNELAWITDIGDWAVSVDVLNGSYTIEDLPITVIDRGAAVTHDLSIYFLEQRRCTLKMGYDGLALEDYCTVFAGIVGTIASNGDNTYTFNCQDYNRLDQRVVFLYGDAGTTSATTSYYSGTHSWITIVQTTLFDSTTGVTTPSATVTFADSGTSSGPTGSVVTTSGTVTTTTVTTSRSVLIGGTPTTIYEIQVTAVDSSNGTVVVTTNTYGGIDLYVNVIISTIVRTVGPTLQSLQITFTEDGVLGVTNISDGALISGNNPRHLIGHPLDMMLHVLQVEIGYADGDINLTQIHAYRDTVFTGVEFEFILTSSVDAKDFIESQLLKPLGGYWYQNSLGQVCIGFAQPLPGGLTASGAFNPNNMVKLPAINPAQLLNVLTMRFDKDDSGVSTVANSNGYLAESSTFYTPSIADLADLSGQVAQQAVTNSGSVQGQAIIESDGMRSGFQGFLLAKMVANSLFSMYGSYNPTFDTDQFWNSAFRLEIGEYVTVTHNLLPDRRAGVIGLTNALFQIVKRSYNFTDNTVTLTLNDASGIKAFGAHRIAPTHDSDSVGGIMPFGDPMADYPVARPTQRARYIFMSSKAGLQSNTDPAANLG